jgi:hypothetical protein
LLSFLFARHPPMIEMNKSTTKWKSWGQYHVLLAYDDKFVCQFIDELQLLRDWSCETSTCSFSHVCNQTVGHIHSRAILWSLGWICPTVPLLPWSYFSSTCYLMLQVEV